MNTSAAKSDGRVVPFDEDNVRRSVRRAAVDPQRLQRVDELLEAVIASAQSLAEKNVIDSSTIGGLVLGQLKRLDRASHVRFALVHLGRLDRLAGGGWGGIGEVRDWLVDQYPDLQHYRPP
ncbi:MAG TPA: ATP cone domain-containing protein [Solirubrobacteraceae bacterium]|jgi:transcriptional regulator NrdR family protein